MRKIRFSARLSAKSRFSHIERKEKYAADRRKIVLCVTGGIAAYKACELTSRLKRGAQVRVVLTVHACLLSLLTFETLSGNPAYTDAFERKFEIEHVALAKWADAVVVAPATANILAKMACGIADELVSTTLLAATAPVLVAPAMNAAMWRDPATQANVNALSARGIHFVGPESGFLACGDADVGRMSEPEQIVNALEPMLEPAKRDLEGETVLVTAGPTVEKIDPVRFITNRSTGKMGYAAIAEAAAERGAKVILASGPVNLNAPKVRGTDSGRKLEAALRRGAFAFGRRGRRDSGCCARGSYAGNRRGT